jgi:uncharacterized protein YlxW (UPF0749 family)
MDAIVGYVMCALLGAGVGAGGAWMFANARARRALEAANEKMKARAEHLSLRATRRLREANAQLNGKVEELTQQLGDLEASLKDQHAREMEQLAKQLMDAHDDLARSVTASASPREARAYAPTTFDDRLVPETAKAMPRS